jgi:hypothetical protein
LDEYVFRFNRRHSTNRGLLFWWVVCALVETRPMPRKELGARALRQAEGDKAHEKAVETWGRDRKRARAAEAYEAKAEAAGRKVKHRAPRGWLSDEEALALAREMEEPF